MAEGVRLEEVFKGVAWFLPAYILCIVLLVIFPELVTFLPKYLR
jgi:C4-dicarboxylate transporter, DctM subunit